MQTQTSTTTTNSGLQRKTHAQAGGWSDHTPTLARPAGLQVKTHVKAGGLIENHSQTLVRAREHRWCSLALLPSLPARQPRTPVAREMRERAVALRLGQVCEHDYTPWTVG